MEKITRWRALYTLITKYTHNYSDEVKEDLAQMENMRNAYKM
jgi:hypothetical protein